MEATAQTHMYSPLLSLESIQVHVWRSTVVRGGKNFVRIHLGRGVVNSWCRISNLGSSRPIWFRETGEASVSQPLVTGEQKRNLKPACAYHHSKTIGMPAIIWGIHSKPCSSRSHRSLKALDINAQLFEPLRAYFSSGKLDIVTFSAVCMC